MKALKSILGGATGSCLFLIAAMLSLPATPSKAATWGTTDASFFSFFGFTDDWTVFSLGTGNVQINNHSILGGDLGVGGAGSQQVNLQIQNQSKVGRVILNSNANIHRQYDNNVTVGSTSSRNLNPDLAAANNAYNYFKGMPNSAAGTWTSSNSSLSSKLTLGPSNGQLHLDGNAQNLTLTATSTTPVVFNIGQFSINNGAILTLSGNKNDEFVFNIYNGYSVNNHSAINLTGGLTPSDVIYNVVGTAGGVSVNNHSVAHGIILATKQSVTVDNGTYAGSTVVGAIISNGVTINNQAVVESADN